MPEAVGRRLDIDEAALLGTRYGALGGLVAGGLNLVGYLLFVVIGGGSRSDLLSYALTFGLYGALPVIALAAGVGALTGVVSRTRPERCALYGLGLSLVIAVAVGTIMLSAVGVIFVAAAAIGLVVAAFTAHRLGRRLAVQPAG